MLNMDTTFMLHGFSQRGSKLGSQEGFWECAGGGR